MRYGSAVAFRRALLDRLRTAAAQEGIPFERLRKRVVFERLLARLLKVAPNRWALKGALALDFRFPTHARATKDADLVGPADVEAATDDLIETQRVDLDDHFVFAIRRTRDVEPDQPEPTVSFHVTAEVGGVVFDEATLHVGFRDELEWDPEVVRSNLLAFAGIAPAEILVVRLEVQIAEKLHAYTRAYGTRRQTSTRVKDLVDLVLIIENEMLWAKPLHAALDRVFTRRGTHPMPASLPQPPEEWTIAYREMAGQVGLDPNLAEGYRVAAACFDAVLGGRATGRWSPVTRAWEEVKEG